jgi:uncharacterized protein (DUF1501 family)
MSDQAHTGAHIGAHDGCREYEQASRLSRRGFMQGMAAGTGVMVTTQMFGDAMMEASFGATGGNVLVVLSFRGGIDGLGMVVPHGDPDYYRARPSLAVAKSSVLAGDAMFGLHPQLAPLVPLWTARKMAAVHAVGLEVPNRSHFKAIELVEDSDPGSSVRRGWVNRMIGTGGIVGPTEAVHLSSPLTPTSFAGPAPTLATDGFGNLQLAGLSSTRAWRRYAAEAKVWSGTTGPLGQAARSAFAVSKGFATTMSKAYKPANGAAYPTEFPARDLAEALRDAAHLIKANVGTSVISIDFGSWDMHADYGTQEWGQMQSMTGAFARSVAAFFKDLGTLGDRVTLATISEFGRRVEQNGNKGLDHGWGNMMLVMGGGVRGGQYYGSWPGLADGKLVSGDLRVTTDYRNVLGEIVARRFPDRPLGQVFPGLSYRPVGLML